MNNEQKKRRKRGDVNGRFDVIDFLVIRSTGGVRHLPDATLIEQWFGCSLLPEPNSILQYEFRA
jgi:hypothetical protein